MYCFLTVVSTLIDFGYMYVCDWASHTFLPMIPCKRCSLAKIQHHSFSSLIRMPHHHFAYDTVLRDPIVKGLTASSIDLQSYRPARGAARFNGPLPLCLLIRAQIICSFLSFPQFPRIRPSLCLASCFVWLGGAGALMAVDLFSSSSSRL
jgi:hypothetical protein